MSDSNYSYRMLHEIVKRHGAAATSHIDITIQPFVVVVEGEERERFSNLACAEDTANLHMADLVAKYRSEQKNLPDDVVTIKNTTTGVCYRSFLKMWHVSSVVGKGK
jgi:hypothetical protein